MEPTGNNYICWLLYYTAQGGSAAERTGYTYDAYNRNTSVCSAGYVQQNHFFNALSVDELDTLWTNPKIRDVIEARLRNPGGLHE